MAKSTPQLDLFNTLSLRKNMSNTIGSKNKVVRDHNAYIDQTI